MTKRLEKPSVVKSHSLTEAQARACVNRFLLSEVGSQFCAGEPALDVLKEAWRVPILLITPGLSVGQVGEAQVHFQTRELISHTAVESIFAAAERLRKRHHAAIKTAFLQARKG
jgi:hypothetical protein